MGDLKTKTFLLFVAFMLMITAFLPIFNSHVRFNIGNYKYWAIIWFFSLILLSPRSFLNNSFLYAFLFFIIFWFLSLNNMWGDVDEAAKKNNQVEAYSFLVPMSLYAYFSFSKDFKGLAVLVKWTLVFIAITAIMTIYSSTIDPMYARKLVGGEYNLEEAKAFAKLGGGWYGFAGALTCLFPMIIYYYRNSSKTPFSKPLILIFGVLCFVAVLRMQIFVNILISVFVIIFSLLGSRKIRRSLIISGIILSLIILIPKNVYSDLLIRASSYFKPESDVYFKLNDMSTFIELGPGLNETETGYRVSRYSLLWEGLKINPITGFYNSGSTKDISLGFHIYWMYKLTIYGLLFFIPFILIFYIHFKNCIKQFEKEFTFYFLLSIFSGIGLGLMKSLFGTDFWGMLFFVIPGLYYLPLLKKQPTNFGK